MASNKIRVGVIGTGFGLSVHIPGYQLSPETEVVAVCSRRKERGEAAARQYEIPHVFTDHRQMLDMKEIDLVSVASPDYLHFPMAMDALDAGKHVLCEKPFGMNLEEAKKLYQKASNTKLTTMVNTFWRYIPSWAKVKELVDQGYIGEPRHILLYLLAGAPQDPKEAGPWSWTRDETQGTGFMSSSGSHGIDALRWWFGEFAGVYGQKEIFIKERNDPETGNMRPVTVDDAHSFTFRMANGAMGNAFGSLGVAYRNGSRMEAHGSEGTLVIEDESNLRGCTVGDRTLKEIPIPTLPPVPPGSGPRFAAFLPFVKDLANGIREGTIPSPNFYDGLKHMEVIEALRRSHSQSSWVSLPL